MAAAKTKIALISGGARGIGRGLGLALAQDGWDVAFCYRTSTQAAKTTRHDILNAGRMCLALRCDLSKPQAAKRAVRRIEEEWGGVDALINCVGAFRRVPLLDDSATGWQDMFSNNLHPVFYLCQAVAGGMRKRKWGRIINFSIAKVEQMAAQPNITAHYIAKAGVLILTRTLAKILAVDGITVNAISPGFIDSAEGAKSLVQELGVNIPAGRLGKADEVVAAVRYLLSEEAAYVNGTNLVVSGGWGV